MNYCRGGACNLFVATIKYIRSMHVFFQPLITGSSVTLNEDESKHCVRVLRMQKGDRVHLADGRGTHAVATVSDDNPKKCVLEIVERTVVEKFHPYYLHIFIAPTKNFDRMEWFIEKATEAGIDEITFIETANSERSKINPERCEKIAISAMKQSKQWWLPKISGITRFRDAIGSPGQDTLKLVAWCETPHDNQLHEALAANRKTNITFLIGPEGDFTADEIAFATNLGFKPVSLGKSILRTETAALYACMAVKALQG
jgi:16S rRNA (uracil1498-N3)-methyltransferase